MRLSNKVLLGGAILPIVLFLVFVVYMSINSTNDKEYQLGEQNQYSNSIIF